MSKSTPDLEAIAQLAAIKLHSDTRNQLRSDVEDIMNFVKTLHTLNTNDVSPLLHPLDITQPLREDVADTQNYKTDLERIAPAFEAGHYLVPKVIDQKS